MARQKTGKRRNSAHSHDIEAHANGLLAQMTLDEKIAQMSGSNPLHEQIAMLGRYNLFTYNAGGCDRLGIEPVKFTDGPRGVSLGHATCFPVPMARGAAWDTALEERIGEAMGLEARAAGANFFGGVCINVLRHPAWGRAQETYGEDPHCLGALGVAFIHGLQRHVMACVKHFACNSIEESRFFVDVRTDERTLREIYLPHFKKCADAGVAAFMSAYNRVNGDYCGQSRTLLTEILKEEWGFGGFVMSDFLLGVHDGEAAAQAGLDIEMPVTRCYGRHLKQCVADGKVPVETIDEAVKRILRTKEWFTQNTGGKAPRIDRKKHAALALEASRKSIVLLKNDGGLLPLRRNATKTIAVIGELANARNLGDRGSSRVRPPYCVTPLLGLQKAAGPDIKIKHVRGRNLTRACDAARAADAVVLVCGLSWKEEGEFMMPLGYGGDRKNLRLPPEQEELIKAVSEANPHCIVVLEGGSTFITERWKDDVPAVLMAWYPGMEGGTAIGEILFGDVCPSGKLPTVFPESATQLPPFDNRAFRQEYGYYHGYRLLDKQGQTPAFAFGFGLSYTTFRYAHPRLAPGPVTAGGFFEALVDVTNTGDVAADEIVQLYTACAGSGIDRPVKDLRGFARVSLSAGETKTVTIRAEVRDLAWYDPGAKAWKLEGIEYIALIGPSSRPEDLLECGRFRLAGTTLQPQAPGPFFTAFAT